MKNRLIQFVLLAAVSAGSASCLGDMDIIQKSKITTSNMWLDEGDATGALYGMYHQFRATFQTAMIYWGDYRAGTFTNGAGGSGSADKMFNNALDSSETKGTNWGSSYTTINNANLILRHVPDIAFSDENQKNLILANAHFVRAYTYYNIVRVWGDAPLLLEGFESSDNDLQPSRSDAALIYEQVARDIDDALRLMPASAADCTIATRSAVQMLKADYNLWLYQTREGGDDALTAADEALAEVFKDSRLDLIGSYADIFDITKKNNAEIILTLHFGQGEYEGGYAETYLIPQTRFHSASEHIETHVKLMTANDQRFIFSPSLVELLYKDERDTRTPVSYGDWTDEEEGYRYTWVNKFAGKWADNKRYFISDLPLYRYAEALALQGRDRERTGQRPDGAHIPQPRRQAGLRHRQLLHRLGLPQFQGVADDRVSEGVRRRRQELVELHPPGLRLHEDRIAPRPPERDQHPAVAHHDRLHERKSEYPSNGRLQLKNTPR